MTEPTSDGRFGDQPGVLEVESLKGKNRLRLRYRRERGYLVRDSQRVRALDGCRSVGRRAALCPSSNPDPADGYADVELGPGNDRFRVVGQLPTHPSARLSTTPTSVFVSGGTGNDVLRGSPNRDDMQGDNGSDRIFGLNGPDRLNDRGAGIDRIYGGRGRDSLSPAFNHFPRNQRDVLFAGPGNDDVSGGVKPVARRVDCGRGSRDRLRLARGKRRPKISRCEEIRDFPRAQAARW